MDGESIELFRRAGLQPRDSRETAFRLPCPAFAAGCCSIYDKRSTVCRTYRCALRIRYDEGQVPLADAERIIAVATSMRDKLRPALERVANARGRRSFEQLCSVALPKLEKQCGVRPFSHEAEVLLDIGAMNVLLTRHFRIRAMSPRETDGRQAIK